MKLLLYEIDDVQLLYEIDDVHWLMLTDVKHIKKSVLCAQDSPLYAH